MTALFAQPVQSKTSLPITQGSFTAFTRDILGHLFDLHEQHGPIAALEENGQKVVFLFDPVYNKQVLSDSTTYEAHFFAIRGPRRSSQRRVTCGLLAMNGDQHRRNRRMVKEPFSLKAIASYSQAVDELIDQQVARWRVGQRFDLNAEMTRFMLGVTSSILFGLDNYDEAYELGEQIAHWVTLTHNIGAGALVPCTEFNERYEELLDFAEVLEASVMRMIEQRRRDSTPGRDVLSILVRSFDEEGGLSDEELVGQACVLFGAAHMTTAHSLTWTLSLLAQHPRVAQRLWNEGVQLAPPAAHGCPFAAQAAQTAPADAAAAMPLVDRVIKESMRVLPASAYSQRVTAAAVKLGPFDLPRGTPIVFTPLITHRLPDLYPDPKKFDPDRWLTIKPGAYEYHPFGAGNRMCIGGPLAMQILRSAIPRFLQHFRFEIDPGAEVDAEVMSTMLNPKHGVPVTLREADGTFASTPITGNVTELVDLPRPERVTAAPKLPR
jgi:cytochrome P450